MIRIVKPKTDESEFILFFFFFTKNIKHFIYKILKPNATFITLYKSNFHSWGYIGTASASLGWLKNCFCLKQCYSV